ncbi:MAG TPA: signal recognition particle protein [Clostridiales bacterium]|nr:signal recognition particle protein [Clostridiales bacterium]
MALLEGLSGKLGAITARMRGKTRVSEQDIKDMMREIRLALLEADVNYQVVKDLTAEIAEKSKGSEVLSSLTPGQQIVKIVHESLIDILGQTASKLAVSPTGFTVFMLYGLQGAGKTTTAAKMALMLKKRGKKPLLTSVDVHRPAAARQLDILARQCGVPCFIKPEEPDAVRIAEQAVDRARYLLCDTLIVDTAGRMTIDNEMMQELKAIGRVVSPTEKLLIVDAMIGQEAVNVALSFDQQIGLDGFIMTKLDSDARGGAALSIRRMTGKPIKLICVGEKIDDIEEFHPDRLASRILGMGDVLTLIEKATANIDEKKALESIEKLRKNQFTLEDMLAQFTEVKKMGSLKEMLGMLPGMGKNIAASQIDEKAVDRNVAIIRSMTRRERLNPGVLNASRRKRIAAGSGTTVQDVNRLVRQFEDTQKLMKQFGSMTKGKGKGLGFGKRGFPF